MSILDINSQSAMAKRLSIPQLEAAVRNGTLESFIAIPLIAQKTKLANAARSGEQPTSSVASQVMEQAGVAQLPSNLPMMEDEEMGMAGGGIIAFSEPNEENNNSLVTDPYVVQDREGGRYDPRRHPSRGRYDMNGPLGDLMNLGSNTPEGRAEAEQRARDRQAMKDTLAASGEGINKLYAAGKDVLSMPVRAVAGAGESVITRPLRAMGVPIPYLPESFYGGDRTSMTPFMDRLRKETAARSSPATTETTETSPQGSLTEGITPASVAASEAALPRPAPTGTPSAPRTAPTGSTSPARSTLPPTLAAAERSDSPAANQATSMLDKYIAQLEKSGESVGRDKKEAMYMALIQGGLAAAGGMSPNALQNIAQGAMVGAQNYQQAMRDIKKEDRARIEKLINAGLSKEKFAMELRKLGIEDKKADAMINYYNARAGAAGSGSGDNKQARLFAFNAKKDLNRVEEDVAKLRNSEIYKKAKSDLAIPFDPKKSSRALVDMRTQAQATIDEIEKTATRRLNAARDTVAFYNKEAGISGKGSGSKEDVDLNQFFK